VWDEGEDNLDQFYLFGGMGINSHLASTPLLLSLPYQQLFEQGVLGGTPNKRMTYYTH